MSALVLLLATSSFLPRAASAQDSLASGAAPSWIYADSNLVEDPGWISATVSKNVIVVAFKQGASDSTRRAIVAKVHGVVVQIDNLLHAYTVRVPTHPDACTVKQAMELLDKDPSVSWVTPEMWYTTDRHAQFDPGSTLTPVSATHHGSGTPCPSGVGLLK